MGHHGAQHFQSHNSFFYYQSHCNINRPYLTKPTQTHGNRVLTGKKEKCTMSEDQQPAISLDAGKLTAEPKHMKRWNSGKWLKPEGIKEHPHTEETHEEDRSVGIPDGCAVH